MKKIDVFSVLSKEFVVSEHPRNRLKRESYSRLVSRTGFSAGHPMFHFSISLPLRPRRVAAGEVNLLTSNFYTLIKLSN